VLKDILQEECDREGHWMVLFSSSSQVPEETFSPLFSVKREITRGACQARTLDGLGLILYADP
jgi:hypothetical protein